MREVMMTGPTVDPDMTLGYCVMCAIRWKAEVVELPDIQELIQAKMREDGPVFYLDGHALAKGRIQVPEPAAAYGVCAALNNIMVPLCWGHVQGIKFTNIAPADASQVPLLTGRKR